MDTAKNTDVVVHVFKCDKDDPLSPQGTVIVTEQGGIGFCVGGLCIVKPPREWHALGVKDFPKFQPQ